MGVALRVVEGDGINAGVVEMLGVGAVVGRSQPKSMTAKNRKGRLTYKTLNLFIIGLPLELKCQANYLGRR